MRTYCVLLHIFAALLLCDYGMFSKPSPSPSEMSTTAISATSDSHTTVMTTESVTTRNDLSSLETRSDDETSADSNETEISGDDPENYSKSLNESVSVVISSTTPVKHHKEENIDEQNAPEENSFSPDSSLFTPVKKVEFNLDLDLLGSESELSGLTEAEATDAAQNENNNNVSNAGRGTAEEVFTEISLDEPKEHA